MSPDQIIKQLDELEAMAEIMEEKASTIKNNCRRARESLIAGVSTPAALTANKDLSKVAADAVAKRRARMSKK